MKPTAPKPFELPATMKLGRLNLPENVRLVGRLDISTHERTLEPGDGILRGDRLSLVVDKRTIVGHT